MLHCELWATIAPRTGPVPCDPDQPFLFPLFQLVESPFLCLACIERPLGRQIRPQDLSGSPWNADPFFLIDKKIVSWRDAIVQRGSMGGRGKKLPANRTVADERTGKWPHGDPKARRLRSR
jgi:hypothetical protein